MSGAKGIIRDIIDGLRNKHTVGESRSYNAVDGQNDIIGTEDSERGDRPPSGFPGGKHHFVVGHPVYGRFYTTEEDCPWVL